MPPSQLKKLKASLRENGIVRQQKSKKQQRKAVSNGTIKNSRSRTNTALQSIREEFNPFEAKPASHGKHDFSSKWKDGGRNGQVVVARPGITKGLGEQKRKKTLLVEAQRRTKVGGLLDRRFGEGDVTMTPEEKALHRFVAEKQRTSKKNAIFDLEDDGQDENLTHLGQNIPSNSLSGVDDFQEADLDPLEGHVEDLRYSEAPLKRRRLTGPDDLEARDPAMEGKKLPEKYKTKNEVMKELISKSKLHKYERQQAKDDDDDLRAELDKDLPDIHALISGASDVPVKTTGLLSDRNGTGSMNPDRMALLNGKGRSQADREYDQRLRQMAMDQRAKPTVATLTSEEKAAHEVQRLQDLERKRLQRMEGDPDDSDSEESEAFEEQQGNNMKSNSDESEVDAFNLGLGLDRKVVHQELGVEDEDDFIIDDDLVDNELGEWRPDIEDSDRSSYDSTGNIASDMGDEFEIDHDLSVKTSTGDESPSANEASATTSSEIPRSNLAFTYPCPQTHEEFLDVTKSVALDELPVVVQRIRSLYQPQLAADNKTKLANFAVILVDHTSYIANTAPQPPSVVCEALIRHIHSLAKTFPEEIGGAFRNHLRSMCQLRPTAPNAGDLVMFTAISSIFPTSDHFHQVVTPTLLCMTQYLGQKIPSTLKDLMTGTYIASLCLDSQKLSKRYVPEVLNHTLNTIFTLLTVKPEQIFDSFPSYIRSENLQMRPMVNEHHETELRIDFWSIFSRDDTISVGEEQTLKQALLGTHFNLVVEMARLWSEKSAFCEMIVPVYTILKIVAGKEYSPFMVDAVRLQAEEAAETILQLLTAALRTRRPLRLHNHRPMAIKTSLPKFEENYNPDKHYDPNRDRAELSKLKAEHRRERKGALRELRKDANFLARENLREKKERDSAYEKKFKRLVAEIQGEEGREAKLYEKEKRMRKGKK